MFRKLTVFLILMLASSLAQAQQIVAVYGAVIAIQTFGDLWGFNPHCHVLCTDGCFDEKALFRVTPRFASEGLKAILEHKVFRMLLSKRNITPDLITLIRSRPITSIPLVLS